ncbi:MAG TPA: SAM-dependent chlorinase/fluorinase [Tepidisphaeraceae bacterium]|nr:SAM-dependent chlorinase/fluorinase [Tepidisphaeraceae bacterium]
MKPPIVTFTTDFGLADSYVAEMKAAVLKQVPTAVLVDVTHLIGPQDVLAGSVVLERAIAAFPYGTIHVAVVDPGVGTDRRILVVEINRQRVICPDNGLITWAWRMQSDARAYALTWKPAEISTTFHGRDIMAPLAGMLAKEASIQSIAVPIRDPVLLDIAPSIDRGRIIYIDHFGNAITNIRPAGHRGDSIIVKKKSIGPLRKAYADVARHGAVALIGSSGLLEIAIRDGSAAKKLRLKVGDKVRIR